MIVFKFQQSISYTNYKVFIFQAQVATYGYPCDLKISWNNFDF